MAKERGKNMIERGIVSEGKRRNLLQQHGENMVILCDAVRTNYTAKDAIMSWLVFDIFNRTIRGAGIAKQQGSDSSCPSERRAKGGSIPFTSSCFFEEIESGSILK